MCVPYLSVYVQLLKEVMATLKEEIMADIDDTWNADETLPLVEYADEGWNDEEEQLHGNNDDDMTEEDLEIDEIELQKYLSEDDEDVDDDDDDEEEEIEDDDSQEEEDDEEDLLDDIENDSNGAKEDKEDNSDTNDHNDHPSHDGTTSSEATAKQNTKDIKDEQRQRTSSHDKTESKVSTDIPDDEYRKPEGPQIPSGPSEPSGPSKSGPAASIRKTRVVPKEGDLDHFVQAPTKPMEIFRNADGLNGTDRVAADGIASQEECEALMKLIKVGLPHEVKMQNMQI